MGSEWAGADAWQGALDRYAAIRYGNLPTATTHILEVSGGQVVWGERDAPGSPASP